MSRFPFFSLQRILLFVIFKREPHVSMIRQHEVGLCASDEKIETDVELPLFDEAGIFDVLLHS